MKPDEDEPVVRSRTLQPGVQELELEQEPASQER